MEREEENRFRFVFGGDETVITREEEFLGKEEEEEELDLANEERVLIN